MAVILLTIRLRIVAGRRLLETREVVIKEVFMGNSNGKVIAREAREINIIGLILKNSLRIIMQILNV